MRRYIGQLGHWGLSSFSLIDEPKPRSSSATYCLFLKSLHLCFHHELLRAGDITPPPPLELHGQRCGGPGGHPRETLSHEEEPCRCLHPPGFGCTSRSWWYVMSWGCHNPRDLTAFDSVGNNITAGHLKLCLCQSAVPAFLDSNPVAKKVVDGVGKDGARDYFAGLVSGSSFMIAHSHSIPDPFHRSQIQNQKNKQECRYPAHARPSCSIKCPCDFTCGDGYTPSPATGPTTCACNPPLRVCNGVCGNFPPHCAVLDDH